MYYLNIFIELLGISPDVPNFTLSLFHTSVTYLVSESFTFFVLIKFLPKPLNLSSTFLALEAAALKSWLS